MNLTNLTAGVYWVEAVRDNSIYVWQDTNSPSRSKPWVVGSPVRPKAASQTRTNNAVKLVFRAEPGQSYTVGRADALPAGTWQTMTNISPLYVPTDIEITDTNAAGATTRFYRFATPVAP